MAGMIVDAHGVIKGICTSSSSRFSEMCTTLPASTPPARRRSAGVGFGAKSSLSVLLESPSIGLRAGFGRLKAGSTPRSQRANDHWHSGMAMWSHSVLFHDGDRATRTAFSRLFGGGAEPFTGTFNQNDRSAGFIGSEELRMQIGTLAGPAALVVVDHHSHLSALHCAAPAGVAENQTRPCWPFAEWRALSLA